ncbi:HprK-related kinase B [Catenovulum sediminis]|uniref:HprK-related kinase B n=1 Tax=Catenovulum sediminis TaxID=1740262 RepID=UPI00117C78D4|nr:HprK-related kinase B [Catenovulum sediminis]
MMSKLNNLQETIEQLTKNAAISSARYSFVLQVVDYYFEISSNSEQICHQLQTYFAHLPQPSSAENCIKIIILQTEAASLNINWLDWRREAGKSGRKDMYFDFENTRLIYKYRTGMTFLQNETLKLAVGPCLENLNQIVNFINNQYMNQIQHEDWLICHASACAYQNTALSFAGYSGGGKSTIMLHLLNQQGFKFISNDRLFIKNKNNQLIARGIPKLPRVNPGTLLNNSKLKTILSDSEVKKFEQLSEDELWQLEHKYDVDVSQVYGSDKFADNQPLSALFILNWSHTLDEPTLVQSIDIAEKTHLLSAIMKSPGPFYQDKSGVFLENQNKPDAKVYTECLKDIQLFEVTGGVNFATLRNFCTQFLAEQK